MKINRIALVGIILGVLLVADGIYMVATNYNGGETQSGGLLGTGLLDGWVIIISAGIELLASVLAFFLLGQPAKPAAAAPQAAMAQPAAMSEAMPETKSEQA